MTPPPSEPHALGSSDRRRAKIKKRFGLATYAVVAVWAAIFIRATIVVTQPPSQAIHPEHRYAITACMSRTRPTRTMT